jgi:hypothetical protein
MHVLNSNRHHTESFYGKENKSCEMEVSLELNDIYFKMCIKIGGFVLGKLSGKTHTNLAMH